MSTPEVIKSVQGLLDGLTDQRFRDVGIEALRKWRARESSRDHFQFYGDFGTEVVRLLASEKKVNVDAEGLNGPFREELNQRWMRPAVDFMSWLVGAGLAVPVHYGGGGGFPASYQLTTAGLRFLETPDDHPFLPGFLDRIAKRFPNLPDEFVAHMADALQCLDHRLGRPAVSLTGLAYEAAADAAIEYLETSCGFVPPKNGKAAARIAAVLKFIPKLFGGDKEKEGRAIAAWDFADRLRDRRNQASHPRNYPDFSDISEVHEFLQSAGRHLPGLWSVRV